MTFNGNSYKNPTSYTTAQALVNLSMSVIPVYSNKVAATTWTHFQHRPPSENNLYHWFVRDRHENLAVICGQVSRLIVLDFDHPAPFARFKREHPELTNTLIVKTRRGWHVWLRIPACAYVKSRHAKNIDLLAEGKYAICPPSTIKGHEYTIDNATPIMDITEAQIQQIETFVGGNTIQPDIHDTDMTNPLSIHELQGIYRTHAHVGNRNTALFYAALTARDTGWTEHDTLNALVDLHVEQGRAHENPNARYREAVRTVRSAFSRPARPRQKIGEGHLCNTILEALKGVKRTKVLRVWIGLLELGFQPGQYVSVSEAYDLLKPYGIGRDSIRAALNFETGQGRLFKVHKGYENPSPRPPTPANAAIATLPDTTQICNIVSQAKSGLTPQTGRQTHFFRIPTQQFAAHILNVNLCRTADPVTLDDLGSAKSTRHAIHRSFIKRRPGYYDSPWLAKRLGVDVTTKNRYDNEIPDLHKQARYYDIRLNWDNLDEIPPDNTQRGGVFLLDNTTGKHYPANIGIARKLLKQRHEVLLRKQTRSFYWVGSGFDGIRAENVLREKVIARLPETPNGSEVWREAATAYWDSINFPMLASEPHSRAKAGQIQAQQNPATQHKQEGKKPLKKPQAGKKDKASNPRRKMKDTKDERLVEQLQQRINALADDPKHQIAKKTIRGLIYDYGKSKVKRTLRRVERRDNVENPAGFLVVVLRSEAKKAQMEAMMRAIRGA